MNSKLYEIHEAYKKHAPVWRFSLLPTLTFSSQRHNCAGIVGYCSCGTICVSNHYDPQPTWYSMNTKDIHDWRDRVHPGLGGSQDLWDAWSALPDSSPEDIAGSYTWRRINE